MSDTLILGAKVFLLISLYLHYVLVIKLFLSNLSEPCAANNVDTAYHLVTGQTGPKRLQRHRFCSHFNIGDTTTTIIGTKIIMCFLFPRLAAEK
jgi:hypothetical protein